MKISQVKIQNVMGIEELVIQPGCLTLIEGRNAAGKTSVLAALRALLSGGHDPALIRKGTESAEVEMLLDDGVTIGLTVTPSRSVRTVRHPQLGKVSKPQEYIDRLVNQLSVDPVQFLTAKPKDRVQALLEAMPLAVTADQIAFLPAKVAKGLDLGKHALEVLGQAHQVLYDERTGINRASKEKRSTSVEMSRTLPPAAENGDWKANLDSSIRERDQLKAEAVKRAETVKVTWAEETRELEAQLQRDIEHVREVADREKALRTENRDQKLDALRAEYSPKLQELTETITRAQTMLEQEVRTKEGHVFVARLKSEADELDGQSEQLSKALDKLEELKSKLLAKTPIKGVTIDGGEILVDGVPFEKTNEARRIQIALEVARLRAGDLPLVLCDDVEHFDSLNMEKFRKAAAKAGLQIVAARVTDGELAVEAEGGHRVA